jgi:hypothetical protein
MAANNVMLHHINNRHRNDNAQQNAPAHVSNITLNVGDWSLGKVFDIYYVFAEAGDNYYGRTLAGLNANSTFFDVLPPQDPYENPQEG